ncbi:hypothetical protein NHX12_017622 [Muraenolepis orangiensis]|nr:hypothetical protein NHX12_017029 [Muraenolepis orangiensis]KAJ3582078.1 hypothetical protein NHX12_015905 [Muraenolepis orangiensis]KAJ3583367.1 hypothetical protein NHX12_020958 [Muraenolepis orangiensis]KAJ3584582.1 hypothetical protein NHX12_015077 [Muraenolepis orangiensis]KAJ3589320.1 hypothetical protein NHX12_010165 [Muraenolepis orangiensis]
MAEDVRGQIAQRASHFSAFSIACDESTDVSDSAQLLVFLRGVNEDFEVCQELAGLETLKGTTKGVDIFMAVERVMDKNDLKWETLSGITTDGAPAMVGNLAHFPSLREVGLMEEDTPKYLDILNNLEVEFDHRFEDFRGNTTAFELFAQPFSVNVDAVSEELQMELLELQSDSDLHSRFRELSLQDFYRSIPAHRYGKIRKHAQVMLSLFGSTYVCEQAFSLMNLNKSKLRNALSDTHLHDILTLSVSQLEPDIERLLKTKNRLHVSH